MIFEITFTPVFRPTSNLTLSRFGSTLTINGTSIDFSVLLDGDEIPAEVADGLHALIAYEKVKRIGDAISIMLVQPYSIIEPYDGPKFTIEEDGLVELPFEVDPIDTPHPESVITIDPEMIIRGADLAQAANKAARKAEFPDLEPDKFWFMLRLSGQEQRLNDWVASLAEDASPLDHAAVSAKLEFAKFFERDHPMIIEALQSLDISETEFDVMWKYAANI